ncbi:MAG TPA: hypothetical protein VGP50_13350 [Stellaceae bacterium]|jgi:hypothetical protein|nr:hypothetical protein [Stellaceae bacterium]
MTIRRTSEQPAYAAARRKLARSHVVRDFAADWQRWTPAERVTASLLMGTITLAVAAVYAAQIFPY